MKSLWRTLRTILRHPLSVDDRLGALSRYVKWQVGSRLVPGAVLVPFVNETFLIVSPGMTAATQNIYTGLSDFIEGALLLHLLREDSLFVDVGANVGSYTVLAAGAVGAKTMSIEPVPQTFRKLYANIRVNNVVDKVTSYNIGLGREQSTLRFTADQDAMNHVIEDDTWTGPSIDVPVSTLDAILADRFPTLIKLDVEGWEAQVLAGGAATLRCPSLLGLIVEMNGDDASFSAKELAVHECLLAHDFKPCTYDPRTRSVIELPSKKLGSSNTIYLRNLGQVVDLLTSAPVFRVNGRDF